MFTTPKCWSQQIAHTLLKQIYLFTYLEKAVIRSISSITQERNTGKVCDYVLGRLLKHPHERELRLLNKDLLRHPSRQGITDTLSLGVCLQHPHSWQQILPPFG